MHDQSVISTNCIIGHNGHITLDFVDKPCEVVRRVALILHIQFVLIVLLTGHCRSSVEHLYRSTAFLLSAGQEMSSSLMATERATGSSVWL